MRLSLLLIFLLFIEYAAHMSHFASYFLAQQMICCVHDDFCLLASDLKDY